MQNIDKLVKDWLGVGGIFHGAVQIDDREWSFGCTRKDTSGVFCCALTGCAMHTYKQSIFMGDADMTAAAALAIVAEVTDRFG